MNILVVGFGHTSKTAIPTRARSGGETKLLNMLPIWQHLTRNRVSFLTSSAYARLLAEENIRTPTYTLPPGLDTSRFGFLILTLKRTFALFQVQLNENPDLIYSSSDLFFDVIPSVLISFRYPKSVVVSCIFLVAQYPWKMYGQGSLISIRSLIKSWAFYLAQSLSFILLRRFADKVLVLNENDKQQLVERGFKSDSVFVTSGGINVAEIESIHKNKKEYDAVFLGRFHPQKGLLDLPSIWKNVTDVMPGKKLLILGGGDIPLQKQLENRLKIYNLEKVVDVKTHLSRTDILSYVKSARVFVFPSHHESWGFVVVEAMACGLPVVAYTLPYMKSVFTEGIRFVPGYDKEKFAEAICSLLADSTEYKRMSTAAMNQAKRYDWKHVAQREYKLFVEVLKS